MNYYQEGGREFMVAFSNYLDLPRKISGTGETPPP